MLNSSFDNLKNRNPKWFIKGYDDYFFNTDNELYNNKTGNIIKKVVKKYSVGYNLNGKFYTLKNLKPLLTKKKIFRDPFDFIQL